MKVRHYLLKIGVFSSTIAIILMCTGAQILACGFHTSYFRGDFYDDWSGLKERPSFTSRNKNYKGGVLPGVVAELIRILKYVDPYNDAPDSPPWMHYEEGRMHGRESAILILQEIGKKAVPQMVEALVNELRFQTEDRQKLLEAVLAAQNKVDEAHGMLVEEIKRFPKVHQAHDASQKAPGADSALMRAWSHLVKTLPIPVVSNRRNPRRGGRRRTGTRPSGRSARRDGHRKLPRAQHQRYVYYGMNVNVQNIQNLIYANPEALADPVLKNLLAIYQRSKTSHYTQVQNFNNALRKKGGEASSDMIPSEDFVSDLEIILIRLGKVALPTIHRLRGHRNRNVKTVIKRIVESIRSQEKPLELVELKPTRTNPDADRLAEWAVVLWDFGDPNHATQHYKDAKKRIEEQGEKAVADTLRLMEVKPLSLQTECGKVLSFITAQEFGKDYTAWVSWLKAEKKKEKAEQLTKVPEDDFVIESRVWKPVDDLFAERPEKDDTMEEKKVGWKGLFGRKKKGDEEMGTSEAISEKKQAVEKQPPKVKKASDVEEEEED